MFHNSNEQKNSFEELIPFLSARVPKVDDLSAEHALRQAVLSFMKDSYLFKAQTVFYGQRGVEEYILEIPDGHVVYDIGRQGVKKDGRPINFERDGNYEVIRIRNPHHDACYTVDYNYHISPDACEVPESIFQKHLATIVSKAIVLLYTGDTTSYVSPQLFQIAQQEYANDIETISVRRIHNFSQSRPRMKSPRGDRGYFI